MEIALPIIVLALVCLGAYFAFRTIGTSRTAESDASDPVPRLSEDDARPLGDTPEAHDEINPHDLPTDHPGRQAAEAMASDDGEQPEAGETRGMEEGGAAGEDGPEEGDTEAVDAGEAHSGARVSEDR
jgi:hypothetical protein